MSKSVTSADGGLALLCSRSGLVTQVLYDGLGLGEKLAPGRALSTLLATTSVDKGRDFLAAIRAKKAVDAWDMEVRANEGVVRLFFVGAQENDHLAILALPTPAPAALTHFLHEMSAGIHNQDAAEIAVRALLKGKAERERELYPHLTLMNTKLTSVQRDLLKRNRELERLIEEKDLLLRMAAHDLRHPASAVLIYSELLLEGYGRKMSGERQEYINSIHSSTEFMLRMLDDILDIADIESTNLQLAPASLVEIMQQSVSLSRPLAERKQAQFVFRHADSVPAVTVDRHRMEQVFAILIGNAIKYSQDFAEIELRVTVKRDRALVSVRDNGPGIPPDELKDLFTPFQKTRARAAAAEPDSGLGLAIAKRIVNRHGGEIWAKSRVGAGATFYVSLPSTPGRTTPDVQISYNLPDLSS